MIRPVLTELVLFLAPFVAYAIFLVATRAQVFERTSWPPKTLALLAIAALLLMLGSFIMLAHFSGAPPGSTYEPAHMENGSVRAGAHPMTALPNLAEADWLREGPLARLLSVLDRDGEEARVVGGAVRNALLGEPIGDIDIATTALPAEVIAPRKRRRFQARADRASSTARSRWWSRAARSKSPRCARTSRPSAATPM